MKVAGKVVVISGAASGMGREIVLELLRRGARVAGLDINEKGLAETRALAGVGEDRLWTRALDISDKAEVEALPEKVIAHFGEVDGLINCAGIIQPFVPLSELEYSAIERVFAVNWLGTLYLTKSFLPTLLARPEAHVCNISSMGGFLPVPGQTVYGASKAAVKLMTEGLHSELADTKVRVTIVFPGAVATNIMASSNLEMPKDSAAKAARIYPADKAARDIVNGIEKNSYRVLVGSDAKFLDALYRLNPQRATAFIARQMKSLLS